MDDIVRNFFEGITASRPEVPKTVSGTLRFDVQNGEKIEHWRVMIEKGSVSASRSDAPADCVVRMSKDTLAAIVSGRMNAMAALLRGVIFAEGEVFLLAVFRGLLATPAAAPTIPQSRTPHVRTGGGRRS